MQRRTMQREAIRRVLERSCHPLTPQEIHRKAQGSMPGLGIATVYRTIRALAEEGTITQVVIPGESPRYECAHRGHHHFFQCRTCSRVYEIHNCPADLHNLVPPGFVLEDHEVFLFGQCARCCPCSQKDEGGQA